MSGFTQDWEPVVIRKKAPTSAARKDEKAVNAARRAGAEIETVRKGECCFSVCVAILFLCERESVFLNLCDIRWRFNSVEILI